MPDLSVKFRDYSFIGCQEIHKKRSSFTLAWSLVHCACAISRDLRIGDQKRPHIWNPRPQFVYSLYNFYGATMTIKGTLLLEVPITAAWLPTIVPALHHRYAEAEKRGHGYGRCKKLLSNF